MARPDPGQGHGLAHSLRFVARGPASGLIHAAGLPARILKFLEVY